MRSSIACTVELKDAKGVNIELPVPEIAPPIAVFMKLPPFA
jgi:hypothetical protein